MAEFCKECARKCLGFTDADIRRAVLSKEPELCEGCGEMEPVVVMLKPSLSERWDNLGYFLRNKFKK